MNQNIELADQNQNVSLDSDSSIETQATLEELPELDDSLKLIRELISPDLPTVIGLGDYHFSDSVDAFHLEVVTDLLSRGYKFGGIFIENLSYDYPKDLVAGLNNKNLTPEMEKQINTVQKQIRSSRSKIAKLAFKNNIPVQLLINENPENLDPDPEFADQVATLINEQKEPLVYIVIAGKNHVANDGLKVNDDTRYHSVIQGLKERTSAKTISCNILEGSDPSISNFVVKTPKIDFESSSSVGFQANDVTSPETYRLNNTNLMTLNDYDLILFV